METALMERESFEELLERTQHFVDADLGPRRCSVCGVNKSVGRRAGDNGAWICLAGCKEPEQGGTSLGVAGPGAPGLGEASHGMAWRGSR